jgi:hypothetical protein
MKKYSWLIIILGSFIWSLTMFKSGLIYNFGMGFWGPNGHDGIWHISVIRSLAADSWNMPIFAGELLKNYHLGYDLLVAFIYKITRIPVLNLYFQILPPILALGAGFSLYKFIAYWKHSSWKSLCVLFFLYFGGSWGWLVSYLHSKNFAGESMFWSQQSISTLINPPFALSITVLFTALYFLLKALRTKNNYFFAIASFLFGSLIQIKVYAGILSLGGLLVIGLIQMLKREGISLMKVFTGASIIAVLIFMPLNQSSSMIIYKPFWFLETMMSNPDRLNWQRYGEALINYGLAGNIVKGTFAYLGAFLIFLMGNIGTRIIAAIYIIKKSINFKKIDYIDYFNFSFITAGIIIPTFFVQSSTAWNTIQFFYYSLLFLDLLAGIVIGGFFETRNYLAIKILILALVVFITIPTTMDTLGQYLPSRPPAIITQNELEALQFLEKQPTGVVLTQAYNRDLAKTKNYDGLRPLYLYESTAYVSAMTGKPTYLEDFMNLDITGYSWQNRLSFIEDYFYGDNTSNLKSQGINYVYLINEVSPQFKPSSDLKLIFSNKNISIFKVI